MYENGVGVEELLHTGTTTDTPEDVAEGWDFKNYTLYTTTTKHDSSNLNLKAVEWGEGKEVDVYQGPEHVVYKRVRYYIE